MYWSKSASVLFICFTLVSLKHPTCDTNPQNGFVPWYSHSSSPFHSNKRIIFQSSQNFHTNLPKRKKKVALFHFLRACYELMIYGGGNGNPFQHSCWENPIDKGIWQATIHEIAESNMTARLSTWINNIVLDWILKFDT